MHHQLKMKVVVFIACATPLICASKIADFPHQAFRNDLIAAFNNPRQLADLEKWFSNTTSWCDPYPVCTSGQSLTSLLSSMALETPDSYVIPAQYGEELIQNGASGGLFLQTLAMLVQDNCMAQSPQYINWEFDGTASNNLLSKVWWHYDAEGWERQLVVCNVSAGKQAKGRVLAAPAPAAVDGARPALEEIYAQLLDAAKYPTADPRWVEARMSVFANPKNDSAVVSCDPVPDCARGHSAIAAALQAHAQAGIVQTAQSMLTPIWVSGTFGAAVTTFSAIAPTGCLASHIHLETFQLDPLENTKVRETRIYYSDASMTPHNCTGKLVLPRLLV